MDTTRAISLSLQDTEFCKRLKDPFGQNVYHLEALLRFDEAAKLEKGNANVRPPSRQKPAYRAMVETVEVAPRNFHVKNRGITYFCERFEFDNAKKVLMLSIPSPQPDDADDDTIKYGIADGGHTYDVIKDTLGRLDDLKTREDWTMPFVRVHFVSGLRSELADDEAIVEALNTSAQVQQYTLDEYGNKFDELKDALAKSGFDTSLIAFRENEEKEWHVVEIIQRLACFLRERWQLTQPSSMYRSKGKALELYTSEETRAEFRRLYGVIGDVVTFPEFIQSELSKGALVKRRSLAQLKAVKVLKKPETRAGTTYKTEHRLEMAALLPMAAAFRELLHLKGDRYQWRVDPREAFRLSADSLYHVLANRSRRIQQAGQLGMDPEYWSACVPIVMRTKDEMLEASRK